MSAIVTSAPAPQAATAGFVARVRATAASWFARRQTVCDLALLADEDLAHLGVSAREIREIRRIARFEAPFVSRPTAPVADRPNPLSLLTSAALRR